MKRIFTYFILLYLLTGQISSIAENTYQDGFLPIELTDEEKLRLDEIGINHRNTRAPAGILRNPAEWEPSEGVIIRWPLGISLSLVADMSEDVMVTTIVGSSSQQTSATSSYTAGGVNMANTQFVIAATNSIWTRDYGPWFIFEDNQLAIVDHIYNRPRPDDDVIPQVLGGLWGLTVYGMDVIHTGGNHMSDGRGMSMSTKLVYNENPGKTYDEVDSIMLAHLGNDYTVLDYIEYSGIHHIDCWAKFLNPTTILIKDVPEGSYIHTLLDARAEYLSQQISSWGQPYTIVRVYCPTGTAYTNSLILNGRVYVPTFGVSEDLDALQTYENAMPGYEVMGYHGTWYDNDAIHCRTMGVPDEQMLCIHHIPLAGGQSADGDFPISAQIIPCSGMSLIEDSLRIYYRIDGGDLLFINMSSTINPDSFFCEIPAQVSGTEISYFLKAADNSGRIETHPYIGESWAHSFVVNSPPVIDPLPDSFICQSDTYFGYAPTYSDPDEDDLTITYSNYPVWLVAQNDSLVGTTPHDRLLTDFTVTASDAYNSDSLKVTLFIYICGDISGDGAGPDISDLTYLVDYFFGGGPPPPDDFAADIDGTPGINISDLTYLVDYLFGGGSAPVCE